MKFQLSLAVEKEIMGFFRQYKNYITFKALPFYWCDNLLKPTSTLQLIVYPVMCAHTKRVSFVSVPLCQLNLLWFFRCDHFGDSFSEYFRPWFEKAFNWISFFINLAKKVSIVIFYDYSSGLHSVHAHDMMPFCMNGKFNSSGFIVFVAVLNLGRWRQREFLKYELLLCLEIWI